MYAIKMDDGKELITTVRGTIYQNEKRADTLVFLIPRTYEERDMADCSLLMRYVLPSGSGRSEEIEMDPEPYNTEYYRYRLKLTTRFTSEFGTVKLWLTAVGLDNQVVLETGEAMVPVLQRKDISEYLSDKDKSQLEQLDEKVAKLQKEKADNVTYDKETRKLRLTADGVHIGDEVTVPADDYSCNGESGDGWDDMGEGWGDMTGPGGDGDEHWEDM